MISININSVLNALKQDFGYDIDSHYYGYIDTWTDWWKGYHQPFHMFREVQHDKTIKERKLYTLRMAKKVCEDWASILLNEKTVITVADEKSQAILFGDGGNNAGFFGSIDFWSKANQLIEKAFCSGTGAIVPRFCRLDIDANGSVKKNKKTSLQFDYLPAGNIIPLSVENGEVTEAAFASEKIIKGKKYVYLQICTKQDDKYSVENCYYEDKSDTLTKIALPDGIAEKIVFNCPVSPFFIISPNICNNQEHYIGLGQSVYADALDCLMGVDLCFNNFSRDFKLGGKKVFMNSDITKIDENGKVIAPDDVAQQLFVVTENLSENVGEMIKEYNPSLRVGENSDGIQKQLDYLSFKCGLGTKHYQFNSGSVVTATQYMGDKQELIQNASKHYIVIEHMLKKLVRYCLWAHNEILGVPVKADADITVQFDDSYIIDKETERLRDMQEVSAGIRQKWEYRVKWYGEDEDTARAILSENGGISLNFGDE